MFKWIKENKVMAGVIAFVLFALVISIQQFLFTTDTTSGLTGLEALSELGTSFWIWAFVLTAGAGVLTYFIVKHIKNMAGYGVSYSILIPVILLLTIAWVKGCEVKADGIGGSKHVPTEQTDSLRQAAEDMLKR